MKVLITHQFNEKMKQLAPAHQSEVVELFNFSSNANRDEIINSALLTKIQSEDSSIFTLRSKNTRLFCSFNDEEKLIFLDVSSVSERHIKPAQKPAGETTVFGRNGEPAAYVAHDDENTIYTFGGQPCAYIDESKNVYGFNGRHLGWFEDGIIWNHTGRKVGFIKTSCPVFTSFEPFKGFKKFKPLKGLKHLAPLKPLKSMANSEEGLLSFLKQGR
jgi:mRNA-degrading endonuclease RelE of RelBE toxin-antitoxin system